MTEVPSPDLTVVVAAVDSGTHLSRSLEALVRACGDLACEILVVGPLGPAADHLRPGVTFLSAPADSLTPELWARGIAQATGRVVALTTSHFAVSPGWGRALVDAIGGDTAAAGGPLTLARNTGPTDWAVFFLRYSAFLERSWSDGLTSGEIAGDNAAYRREDLVRHAPTFDRGFWEVDFHRLLRADGLSLRRVSRAGAALIGSFPVTTFLRQRFAHGREFAAGDVRAGRRGRIGLVLRAPAVPFVMALRAARRVGWRGDLLRFAGSVPMFLLYASAWAAGEATGALRPAADLRSREAGDLA